MDGSSEKLIHYLNPNHPPLSGRVIDDNNAALFRSPSIFVIHTHIVSFQITPSHSVCLGFTNQIDVRSQKKKGTKRYGMDEYANESNGKTK